MILSASWSYNLSKQYRSHVQGVPQNNSNEGWFQTRTPQRKSVRTFWNKGSQPFSTYLSFLVASSQVPSGGVKRLGSPRLSSPSRHWWRVVSAYTRGWKSSPRCSVNTHIWINTLNTWFIWLDTWFLGTCTLHMHLQTVSIYRNKTAKT